MISWLHFTNLCIATSPINSGGAASMVRLEFRYNTSSGASSNSLPPIVKATVGMEGTLSQSTADSPIGFGIRSQSCKSIMGISKRSMSRRPKKLLRNNACIITSLINIQSTNAFNSPDSHSPIYDLVSGSASAGFASRQLPFHKQGT